jgi:phage-related protein
MPLLADAYADVHLNTKTLDTDIDRVEKKLERAVERFQKKLSSVEFKLDTTQAIKRLRDLQISADKVKKRIAENTTLGIEVDQAKLVSDAEVARQIVKSVLGDNVDVQTGTTGPLDAPSLGVNPDLTQSFDAGVEAGGAFSDGLDTIPTPTIPVDVDPDRAQRGIAEIKADIAKIAATVKAIPVDIDDDRAIIVLRELRARLVKLKAETANINVDVDDIDALVALAGLESAISSIDGDTARIAVKVLGTGKALAELGVVDVAKNKVDGDANVNVDVNGAKAAIGQLGAVATAAASATVKMGTFSGIAQAPLVGLAGVAAAFGPTIPGLLGSAAGFLAVGAGATAAAAGVGLLGVALNKVALNKLKDQLEPLKAQLITATQPFADIVTDQIAPKFVAGISTLIKEIAPVVDDFFLPISDSLLAFVSQFSGVTAQLAGPIGKGFASIIDTIGMFVPTMVDAANAIGGPFVDALNALIELLFGTADSATGIWVSAFNGLADLARNLIGPFNDITNKVKEFFSSIGGDVGNIFGDLGDLLIPFIDGILDGLKLIIETISDIGLENLLYVVAGIAAVVGGPGILAGVGAILFLKESVQALRPLFEGLAPVVAQIGQAFRSLFAGATELVRSFIKQIDFNKVQAALAPFIAGFRFIAEAIRAAAPTVGEFFGKLADFTLDLYIQFQQFAIRFYTTIIGPVGQSVLNLASAWLTTWGAVYKFLYGPFLNSLIQVGKVTGLILDPLLGTNIRGSLDGLEKTVKGVGSALDTATTTVNGWRDGWAGTTAKVKDFGEKFIKLQTQLANGEITLEQFMAALGLASKKTESAASSVEVAKTKIEELREQYQKGKIDANKFYSELAKATKDVLPQTSKAFQKLQEIVAKGVDLKAGADFAKKSKEELVSAAESIGKQFGGGLGSLFQISDNDAAKVESGAKKVYEALTKWLAKGKLSSFIDTEAVDVGKSLDELIRTLELKAQNLGRLRQLEALGLPFLASQLATLNDNPEALRDALDQIFGGGIDAARGFENRLGSINGAIDDQLSKIGPAVAAGLGQAPDEIANADANIGKALDKLTKNIRLKAANIRRLNQLENLGAGALAEQLATLADDPEALSKALDQLFAGGVSSIRAANGQIESALGEVETAAKNSSDRIAKALNFEKAAKTATDKNKVSFTEAVDGFNKKAFGEIAGLNLVRDLEARGFKGLSKQLAVLFETDPELFLQYADEIRNSTDQQKLVWEASLVNSQAGLEAAQAEWTTWFQTKFGVIPPSAYNVPGEEATALTTAVDQAFSGLGTKIAEEIERELNLPPITVPEPQVSISDDGTASGAGKTVGQRIVDGIVNGTALGGLTAFLPGGVGSAALGIIPALIDNSPFINKGKEIGAGIIDNIVLSAQVTWTATKPLLDTVWTQIKDAFKGDGKDKNLVQSGKDLIDGLWNGISGKTEEFVGKLKKWVTDNIPSWVRKVLEMKSPSRVMMDIGGMAAEGLLIGFTDSLGFAAGDAALIVDPIKNALDSVVSLGEQTGAGLAAGISSGFGSVNFAVGTTAGATGLTAPTTGFVAAPVPVVAAGGAATQGDSVIGELRALRTAVEQTSLRPLIGEYKVETTKQPQSPEQLAADAAFVKALLM